MANDARIQDPFPIHVTHFMRRYLSTSFANNRCGHGAGTGPFMQKSSYRQRRRVGYSAIIERVATLSKDWCPKRLKTAMLTSANTCKLRGLIITLIQYQFTRSCTQAWSTRSMLLAGALPWRKTNPSKAASLLCTCFRSASASGPLP